MNRSNPVTAIRLPAELKLKLKTLAGANRRSLNGEIVFQLEQALADAEVVSVEARKAEGHSL